MKKWFVVITTCLAVSGCAGMLRETTDAYYIAPADVKWQIKLPTRALMHSRDKQSADGKSHLFSFMNLPTGGLVFVLVEPTKGCNTSTECRDQFVKYPDNLFVAPQDVSLFEENGFSVYRCVTPANGLIHYSAHQVRDGYWIEIRAEKFFTGQGDQKLVADLAKLAVIEPKP